MATTADQFVIDLNDLTIEEIEVLEDITDAPFDEALKPGRKRGKVLRALAFIVNRREDPDFTLEQAGALKITLTGDSSGK